MKEDNKRIEILQKTIGNYGLILTVVAVVFYLLIVWVIIDGFETEKELNMLTVFVVLGAIVGVMISLSLRLQGIQYAKDTPTAKAQLEELRDLQGKSDKTKIYPIWVWFTIKLLLDFIFKGVTSALMLYFSISIMYEGIKDYTYMLLAITNVVMFVGFGMLGLSGGYQRYLYYQIPYNQQKIEKLKKEGKQSVNFETIERINHEGL